MYSPLLLSNGFLFWGCHFHLVFSSRFVSTGRMRFVCSYTERNASIPLSQLPGSQNFSWQLFASWGGAEFASHWPELMRSLSILSLPHHDWYVPAPAPRPRSDQPRPENDRGTLGSSRKEQASSGERESYERRASLV